MHQFELALWFANHLHHAVYLGFLFLFEFLVDLTEAECALMMGIAVRVESVRPECGRTRRESVRDPEPAVAAGDMGGGFIAVETHGDRGERAFTWIC